jgi:hypothetical protein
MNMGCNVVMLDGDEGCTQNKAAGQKTRTSYEGGQCVMHMRAPLKESEAREESNSILKGDRFAILATETDDVFSRRVYAPSDRTEAIIEQKRMRVREP